MALQGLLGDSVIDKSKNVVSVASLLPSGGVLGLYFSAHWCPPCRGFTPKLAEWYKTVKSGPNGSKFEIVFVSSDKDEHSFSEYFAEMPWHALPFSDRDRKGQLSKKFKVNGIPTLLFLDATDAKLITGDGRSVVMDDTTGSNFPWKPLPFTQLIEGKFVDNKGNESSWSNLKDKVIGLYFSAHWCGPCRGFTPILVKTYNLLKSQGKNFEVIFCSSDRDLESFKEYFSEMPWLAIPFGDGRKKSLSQRFEVSGIPTLIILDWNGTVINANGRNAVAADQQGLNFPWHPLPVNKLTPETASDINDNAAVIWFTDSNEESVKTTLRPIAEKYFSDCKQQEKEVELCFFYCSKGEDEEDEDDEIVTSLRNFAKLPDRLPLLVIIDIPSQQVFVSDKTTIDAAAVEEFVRSYEGKTLQGNPLHG
eukprot:Em0015g170a